MTTLIRCRGRSESFVLLWTSLILGFSPVAAYYSVPGTRLTAVVFGAGIGLPFFLWALWRLLHMDALVLSSDGRTLIHFRRSPDGRRRLDIPVAELESISLDNRQLEIRVSKGRLLRIEVDTYQSADAALRPLADILKIPYNGIAVDD